MLGKAGRRWSWSGKRGLWRWMTGTHAIKCVTPYCIYCSIRLMLKLCCATASERSRREYRYRSSIHATGEGDRRELCEQHFPFDTIYTTTDDNAITAAVFVRPILSRSDQESTQRRSTEPAGLVSLLSFGSELMDSSLMHLV